MNSFRCMMSVNFVYKIVPSSSPPPSPLPCTLPPSNLDKEHGFIHLSTARQIPGTLRLVFKDETRVYLLKVDYKKVEKDVKWEEGSCVPGATGGICNYMLLLRQLFSCKVTKGTLFPHLYNDLRIGKNEIVSVVEWERDSEDWDGVVNRAKEDGWLID